MNSPEGSMRRNKDEDPKMAYYLGLEIAIGVGVGLRRSVFCLKF